MLDNVADLYAHIFLFLSSVLDLLMRKRMKRMLDSFNDNLNKKFEKEIESINEKSAGVRNLVARGSRAEIRETRLTIEQLGRDIRIGQMGEARDRAEMEHYMIAATRELQQQRLAGRELSSQLKELSARLNSMLQEGAVTWIGRQRIQGGKISSSNCIQCEEEPNCSHGQSPWTSKLCCG